MMWHLTIVAGAVIGVMVGMTGTGGAFIIPALVYGFGMGQMRAQGTALLIAALPVWIVPLVPYRRAHHVDWKVGLLRRRGRRWAATLAPEGSRCCRRPRFDGSLRWCCSRWR